MISQYYYLKFPPTSGQKILGSRKVVAPFQELFPWIFLVEEPQTPQRKVSFLLQGPEKIR